MSNLPDLEFFRKLSNASRIASLPYFRQILSVDNKEQNGFDPVTIADRETELALREIIQRERPDDGIQGEEFPAHIGNNDDVWVIDPIDGTRAFISGLPVWGCLVGLKRAEKAVAGMMAQPFTQELYYASGKGAFLYTAYDDKSRQLKTSNCCSLSDAILFSTAPELFKGEDATRFNALSEEVKLRRFGTDCYAFAMLASGFVDLVVETGLKPYDIMALIPIVEQSGGVITQWDGGRAEKAGNIIAAANPQLYEKAIQKLNGA
ncbi:histidinol-phosphatase [Bartonella sp. LJL80]